MFDVFGWLRKKARDAVLGGIADAVQEVAPGDAPADLDGLRALLARTDARALAPATDPAPEPEPAARRKAK
ncbi:unnamed protein product [Gemmataceae bacterium]|nr:unnamed protein product [Gemmataceae bacterium]VTT97605.1 unnamed protein product [Gemmataceae bacterium]